MGDNGSRRGAYQLPSIKSLTGGPPRPAAPPPLPPDARQPPQSLPLRPPQPRYEQQRHYIQPPVPQPPPPPLSSHYSQPPPPPPPLPPAASSSTPRHDAPLPHSGIGGHSYGDPPRQEYPPFQHQQHHYTHAHTHSHAPAQSSHPHHGYSYAQAPDQPIRYGEQAAAAAAGPMPPYHQPLAGRLGGTYSGSSYPQKYAADSGQPSPRAGPMDVADVAYSHPQQRLPPPLPSPDQAVNPSMHSFQHSHYHPPPPPLSLSVRPPQNPLPRPLQQTIHSHTPHYSHTQQAYSSYAPTARENPTNAAAYDAYGMPAALPSASSEANVGVSAVDARLVSRPQTQKQLAPAPASANRTAPPPLPATIASHAPAPLKPPAPPPPAPTLAATVIPVPAPIPPPPPPAPTSVASVILSKDSAVVSNIDEDEDEDDDDDDDNEKGEDEALIKRRKRNAQSAARLRERRKTREFELTSSCTKLESQIARLEDELTDEKRRAKLDFKSSKSTASDAAASTEAVIATPTESTLSSVSGRRRGTKRQWLAAQTDGEGDFAMGNAEEEDDREDGMALQQRSPKKKSRPLRELDQVRLDDLRSKIETLGKLNQKVCVNLGLLRQEIQRISNAIISQKSDRHVLAVS